MPRSTWFSNELLVRREMNMETAAAFWLEPSLDLFGEFPASVRDFD
jgi:hypothetical protein